MSSVTWGLMLDPLGRFSSYRAEIFCGYPWDPRTFPEVTGAAGGLTGRAGHPSELGRNGYPRNRYDLRIPKWGGTFLCDHFDGFYKRKRGLKTVILSSAHFLGRASFAVTHRDLERISATRYDLGRFSLTMRDSVRLWGT